MIPAEAVEAASKAMFDVRDDPYDLDEWSELDAIAREPYVCQARAALKAAAPLLMAHAWDAAVASLVYEDGSKADLVHNGNPYRPSP